MVRGWEAVDVLVGKNERKGTYGHRERRQSWRLNGVLLLCECVRECVRERERAVWRCVCVLAMILPAAM